ncbi:hypothetical protein C2845_PM01G42650 [Panicum miliaceum]|uniref:Polygalacturonase n=1 Tax=Panicum miliaceum TaxID=4540 RepID=A0A3L6TV30_PANMI|nr:hypothetical protein C2845_PM01G42650 [Panicum miliaceum]
MAIFPDASSSAKFGVVADVRYHATSPGGEGAADPAPRAPHRAWTRATPRRGGEQGKGERGEGGEGAADGAPPHPAPPAAAARQRRRLPELRSRIKALRGGGMTNRGWGASAAARRIGAGWTPRWREADQGRGAGKPPRRRRGGPGVHAIVGVPNDELLALGSSPATATTWVARRVLPFAGVISAIVAGDEVPTALPSAGRCRRMAVAGGPAPRAVRCVARGARPLLRAPNPDGDLELHGASAAGLRVERWVASPPVNDLREFGVVGDERTVNTAAEAAVVAIAERGGGRLTVPAGRWLTAQFNLTSRMTPFLAADDEILGIAVSIPWGFERWLQAQAATGDGDGRLRRGPTGESTCVGAGSIASAQLHKRWLPLAAGAPKGKHEAPVAEAESSTASVESCFVPPGKLDLGLGLLVAFAGFSVGTDGAESDNSEDRSSKSSTAGARSACSRATTTPSSSSAGAGQAVALLRTRRLAARQEPTRRAPTCRGLFTAPPSPPRLITHGPAWSLTSNYWKLSDEEQPSEEVRSTG